MTFTFPNNQEPNFQNTFEEISLMFFFDPGVI